MEGRVIASCCVLCRVVSCGVTLTGLEGRIIASCSSPYIRFLLSCASAAASGQWFTHRIGSCGVPCWLGYARRPCVLRSMRAIVRACETGTHSLLLRLLAKVVGMKISAGSPFERVAGCASPPATAPATQQVSQIMRVGNNNCDLDRYRAVFIERRLWPYRDRVHERADTSRVSFSTPSVRNQTERSGVRNTRSLSAHAAKGELLRLTVLFPFRTSD